MDSIDDIAIGTANLLEHTNNFELHDFIDDPNFGQFINLIRGDNEDQISGFDCDLINSLLVDNRFGPTPGETFDFGAAAYTSTLMAPDPNYAPLALPSFDGEDMKERGEEDNDGEYSYGTTTTTTTTTMTAARKTKADRSRTLTFEQRRRGRMKENLYALRSLVPNITKMDKASIIGDAVLYVQELQMQAKKLKAEIADLEASLITSERCQGSKKIPRKIQIEKSNHPACKNKLLQMDAFQVEERGFYVRLVSNKGEGVAGLLYRALESLANFTVQNSYLATASDRFILTFTLIVKKNEQDMNLPNLKLWVAGAFVNQGFEFLTSSLS